MSQDSKWRWHLRQLGRKVWVRAVAYGVVSVATALAARLLRHAIPDSLSDLIGVSAAESLLSILASSMLAVTTFSLSISVQAFSAATTNATPRATELLMTDRTTQSVLATFIGAFIYSLVGIIALRFGFYGDAGRVVLFFVSVAVVALVIAALIRWIGHLTYFGRLGDTIARLEDAAGRAMRWRVANPYLGGQPLRGAPPPTAHALRPAQIGYVQHIDMDDLNAIATAHDLTLFVAAIPGAFVHPEAALLHAVGLPEDDPDRQALVDDLCDVFSIAETRTYAQDPRFGLIALAEVAQRALSPAVNDPGTAIDVLGRLVRILGFWRDLDEDQPPRFARVFVPVLRAEDMMQDAFAPIARDGRGLFEVQMRLQKALAAVAALAPDYLGAAARDQSARAVTLADLPLAQERQQLEAAAAWSHAGA